MYITEGDNDRVSVFSSEGQFVKCFGGTGVGLGEFGWPCGLTVDNSGLVYVCDYNNNRVQVF